jgi:hypothetical protein
MMHLPFISPLLASVGSNLGDPRRVFDLNQRVIGTVDVPYPAATFRSLSRSRNPTELNMPLIFDSTLSVAESNGGIDTFPIKVRLGGK